MDYGALIGEAWRTTWRHRSLWILGLFAGGAVGVSSGGAGGGRGGTSWSGRPEDVGPVSPDAARLAADVGSWASANAAVIVAAVAVALLFGLGLLVVSIIAQGGMAEATVDLARGRTTSLGQAWRTGRRLFWRYVGLYLLLAGAAIVVAGALGAVVALMLAPLVAGAAAPPTLVAAAVLVGVPLVLAAVVGVIGVSIVVAYAQRAVYAEDAGPVGALRAGWRVLRAHPGASALTWLINLALALGAGIAAGIAVAGVLAVLVVLGMGLWAVAAAAPPRVAYVALAAVVVLAVGALAAAVVNTFFWNYWTLAYLRLTGRAAEPAAA